MRNSKRRRNARPLDWAKAMRNLIVDRQVNDHILQANTRRAVSDQPSRQQVSRVSQDYDHLMAGYAQRYKAAVDARRALQPADDGVLHGEVLGPDTVTSYGYYAYNEFAIVNELALRHLGGLFGSPIPTKDKKPALAYGVTPKKGPSDDQT